MKQTLCSVLDNKLKRLREVAPAEGLKHGNAACRGAHHYEGCPHRRPQGVGLYCYHPTRDAPLVVVNSNTSNKMDVAA